jgi:hypothetical protein
MTCNLRPIIIDTKYSLKRFSGSEVSDFGMMEWWRDEVLDCC